MELTITRYEHTYVTTHVEKGSNAIIVREHKSYEATEDFVNVLLRLAKREPIEDTLHQGYVASAGEGQIVSFKAFDPRNDVYTDEENKAKK
jgi:hypothetical protein